MNADPDNLAAVSSNVQGIEICPTCHKGYKNKAGLSIHQRATHAAQYHVEHQVKPRWCDEEKNRMIRAEVDLLAEGVKLALNNSQMVELFPDRSREAIKGLRRKEEYHLQVQRRLAETEQRKHKEAEIMNEEGNLDRPSEHDSRFEWQAEVLKAIKDGLTESNVWSENCSLHEALGDVATRIGDISDDGCTRTRQLIDKCVSHLKQMISKPKVTRKRKTHGCTSGIRRATGPHGRVRKRQCNQ